MHADKPIRIVALGKYLPRLVESAAIEAAYGLPSGWAEKNSGVVRRHHVTFETGAYMGARAVEQALEKAQLSIHDIDLIIAACATFDYPLPNQSSVIKSELKEALNYDGATIDIDTTCLSFVSGFEIAASLLNGKQYKNIVVVSTEISSKGLNPSNPETLTLFGDAAVAAVLTYDENSASRFIKGGQRNYSEGVKHTIIEGGGNTFYFKDFPYDQKLHSFNMDGIKLLKLAKRKIPEFMDWFFDDLPITITDIDVVLPHQASKAGLAVFKNLYDFKAGQVRENIGTVGNCIAASIPLLLHDEIEAGRIRRGDLCFLTGTSAGFSIGGVLISY